MINESSYASDVADELGLTSSAYAEDVTGEVSLTSTAYGEDVAEAVNEHSPTPVVPDLTVMQYNIGHFNMGMYQASRSYIGENFGYAIDYPQFFDYDTQHAKWVARINGVAADIIGMPEWNDYFGHTNVGIVKTKDAEGGQDSGIFDDYNVSVGASTNGDWWMNTIASKYPFVTNSAEDIDLGSIVSEKAYARVAQVVIKGKSVVIAVTHLNWNKSTTHYQSRKLEIQALASLFTTGKYKDAPYVIICGDFNSQGPISPTNYLAGLDEYQPFATAGFTLANTRENAMMTSSATGSRPDREGQEPNYPFCYLDNIIVRGFAMSNVYVIDDGDTKNDVNAVGNITDHCAVVCDLTLID